METIKKINEIELKKFLMFYKELSSDERIELIKNNKILELSDEKFNIVVLNSNEIEFKNLISYEYLYDKLMNLSSQTKKRTVLNILEESKPNILKLIIESKYCVKYKDKLREFISYLSVEKIETLSEFIDFKNVVDDILTKQNLRKYFEQKISNRDEFFNDLFELVYSKIKSKKINPVLIFKIQNYNQFVLFSKFGTIVDVLDNTKDIILPSKSVLPYDDIINIKDKYVTKLIEMLKQKGKAENYKYLEVALKLYIIFGFDDSKKILDDKFSKLNESTLIKIVDFNFKDSRREYRTKNQNKFYFYGMEQEIMDSLINKNNEIFENLLFEPTKEKIEDIRKEFLLLMYKYDGSEDLKKRIKEKLYEKINERESIAKSKLYDEIKKRVDSKIENYKKTDANILFGLLSNVDLYEKYDSNMLEELRNFLLGNRKSNNDCLLRLILNDEALGLNNNLSVLINNFDLLYSVTYANNLSLNSILDVIDILKMDLYDLKPNEQDITLETLTRIINSTEYVIDSSIDIIKEVCRIHIERKNKVFSNIPTVSGKTDEFEYFVAPFDSEYLLAAGNDGKNCLKVSGLGQEFFEYCLKNKSAVIIYLIDKNGNKYICPTVRSGNAINCNGIDPAIEPSKINSVLNALSMCFKDIINLSYDKDRKHNENIEIATVTDLHLEDYFKKGKFEKYDLKKTLPLDNVCYCDYNKPGITHYVLAKSSTYSDSYYYISNDKYYQKRDQDYEFDVNKEYDKERLYLIINSIYYSSIDYQNISYKEKNKRKREFKPLNIDSFKYITGNKDWFVAIDDNYNIISCLLPYDTRAKQKYIEAVAKAPILLEQLIGDSYGRKNL